MDNIYLIGMMGSGKSVVGKKLANQLNMNYVDIDIDLESINDMKILDIFSQSGEKKFREMESAYFIEKSKQTNCMFSTGGGIILDKTNRFVLKNNGVTFFLEGDCNVLFNRLKHQSNRPLLNSDNPMDQISLIWEKRKEYYYESSHYTINTNDLSIDDVVNEIILKLDIWKKLQQN